MKSIDRKPSTAPSKQERMAFGYIASLISVAVTGGALHFGGRLSPFGFIGISACVLGFLQMRKERCPGPGYASFFVVLPSAIASFVLGM